MLSLVDAVLRDPAGGGIRLDGSVPIGLVAPIHFQPHPGPDREQVFVLRGADGARHLVWRLEASTEHDRHDARYVVAPLSTEQWVGLLDQTVSVPQVLTAAGAGVEIAHRRLPDASGVVEVRPVPTVAERIGTDRMPEERRPDEQGKVKKVRVAWLGLPGGRRLLAERDDHAEALSDIARWRSSGPPARVATSEDGTTFAAYRDVVIRTAPNGDEEIRTYTKASTAQVVVEREALR